MIAMASRRRSAMVVSATRTAIGIAPEQPLVQQLDLRALDEAQLQQPPLQLRPGQAGGMRPAHVERDNAATKAHGGVAQC